VRDYMQHICLARYMLSSVCQTGGSYKNGWS